MIVIVMVDAAFGERGRERAALIQNKKAAARHKDLADVEELERLARDSY